MAWIRLSDDYIYHPKFTRLSHLAFRLWHEGMAYCRKLLTDGAIPRRALKDFKYATRAAVDELSTPASLGIAPLWLPTDDGFRVHDYLDWNPSREDDQRDREGAKKRMRRYRGSRPVTDDVTPFVTPDVTPPVTPHVPGQGQVRALRKERVVPEESLAMRAGDLVERYETLFLEHRRGARLQRRPALDFDKALGLVQTWADDTRLDKLAVLVLTTDDEWISRTDRGFGIFAMKATWADDRLAAWEAQQKPRTA